MGYSTIVKKKCKCSDHCQYYPTLGYAGFYGLHAPQEVKDNVGSKQELTRKKKNARLYAAAKARSLPENKDQIKKVRPVYYEDEELKLWFYYHMNTSAKICENCGADLSDYNEKDWLGSQDHIIEKSQLNGCPSVATVLENHCVLGKWCCHSQKHTSNLNLSKMKVFPLLKERFAKFEHLIDESERKKIPECFLS